MKAETRLGPAIVKEALCVADSRRVMGEFYYEARGGALLRSRHQAVVSTSEKGIVVSSLTESLFLDA